MAFKPPPEITNEAVEAGVKKADQSATRRFMGAILAGAYIAFGALLAVVVSAGLTRRPGATSPS